MVGNRIRNVLAACRGPLALSAVFVIALFASFVGSGREARAACAETLTFTAIGEQQTVNIQSCSTQLVTIASDLSAVRWTGLADFNGVRMRTPAYCRIGATASGGNCAPNPTVITTTDATFSFGADLSTATFTITLVSKSTAPAVTNTKTFHSYLGPGNATSATTLSNTMFNFTFNLPAIGTPTTPTVAGVSPATGSTVGGTSVAITGTDLTGATAVSFGGTPATSFTVDSATSITATTPAHAAGSVDIGVTTSGGTGTLPASFTYAAPATVTLSPSAGALPGGTVGTAYSQNLAASGGTGPYTYAVTGGSLGAGLSLDAASGAITGTPTTAGTAGFTVTATDTSSASVSAAYTIALAAALAAPVAGNVSATVAANSSSNPVTLALTGGTAASVAVGTPAAHGTATASGTTISYTPTAGYSGSDSFSYTATNATGTSTVATVSVAVTAPTLTLSPAAGALLGGTVGAAYSQAVTASGGTAPVTYAVTVGTLAPGLTLDPNSGAITGTPTTAGSYPITVTATDANSAIGSAAYSFTVAPTALAAPVAGNATATVAANSSANAVTLSLSGGTAVSVTVASAPAHGTAMASGTSITYTPTAGYSGADSFTYTATNATGTSAAATVTVTVTAPTLAISPAAGALPGGIVGTAYSQTIAASGGTAPVAYAVTAGALPAGLTLDPNTGAVSGTPTTAGGYPITVTATDANGATGTANYTFTVASAPLAAPIAGNVSATVAANSSANTVTLSLSGGTAASVAVGTQAAHGTATASGTSITYTPTAGYSGSDSFTYTATNATGTSAPATVTVTVTAPTLVVSPSAGALPGGTVGTAYSQSLAVSGGTAPVTYAVTSGTLAPGLTLTSAGLLSGTPTTAGSGGVTVTATDAYGATGSAAYTFTAALAAPIAGAVTTTVAANSSANPVTLVLSGGTAASVAVGTQAAHGTATASGTSITYTPTPGYSGADSFTYTAINAAGTSAAATVTVTVTAPTLAFSPSAGALPGGTVGAAYSQSVTASGGIAPVTYAVTSGTLSPGLTLDPNTGAIAGTPTTAGSYPITVTATDANSAIGSAAYSFTVAPAALAAPIAGAVTTTVAANSSANPVTLSLSGGTAASVAVGTQAAHGTATASGTSITYTPTAGYSGADSFTYTATNATGTSAAATVTVTVTAATLAISPAAGALPGGIVGTAYSQTVTASGGTAPVTYAVTVDTLAPGLTLDPNSGAITGTPTTAGSYPITVTATDANGATGSAAYTVAIAAQPVTIAFSPAAGALPGGTVGTAYSQTVTASGGTAPLAYAATGLPAGVTIDALTGILSGTPTTAGTYTIVVTATDGASPASSASASYSLVVAPAVTTFVFTPAGGALAEAMAGEAYKQAVSATGGSGALIYSVSAGALPRGLVLNISTGELNGPLESGVEGDYSFTITATDGLGATGSAIYTLKVKPRAVTAPDKVVPLQPGETPQNVYLNQGATGGPFASAAIGFVEPSNAGTALIVEGEVAALGDVTPKGFYLKFTPNPLYAGTIRVGYTLTSVLGTSNTGVVTYTVPLDQAKVAGTADRAVRDFVSARQSLLANHVQVPGLLERRIIAAPGEAVTLRMTPNGNGLGVGLSTSTAQMAAARAAEDGASLGGILMPRLNAWVDGTFLFHKENTDRDREDDGEWGEFGLLSAGVDYLVNDELLLGFAVHSDRMTDPGRGLNGEGTNVEGTGVLAGPYASLQLAPSLFLDASIYYGRSWNNVEIGGFEGDFETGRAMGAIKLEGLISYDAVTLRPNLKASYLRETVEDYSVFDPAGTDVAVPGFSEDDLRFSAGATASYTMTLPNGWGLTPEIGGSLGLSSDNDSDIADGLFGTVDAGFTVQGEDNWSFGSFLTLDMEEQGSTAIGARAAFSIPF